MPRHPTAYGAALALALVTMMLLVPRSTGQTTVHANCPSLASLPGAGGTGLKYYSCPNCCDVSPTCECDQYCPDHPEVWTRGCSVPHLTTAATTRKTFVCPKGYIKCPRCCDVDKSCKCDNKCSSEFPKGFQCALMPFDDEYTSAGPGAVCPGGYTECSKSCDLQPDCRQDSYCGNKIRKEKKSFVDAEAACVQKGGHLVSFHSSEDVHQLSVAVRAARIKEAVWVGGYEDKRDGDWQWIDGTNMDKKMLNKMKNKYFGDNYQGNNEDEMAYCSASCARQVFKDPKLEGLHDWGTRSSGMSDGIGGYVCRLGGRVALDSGYYMRKQRQAGRDGKKIQAFKEVRNWVDAERACAAKGGHLASLHSAADVDMLQKSIDATGIVGAVFVGGYENKGENDWQWVDGTPMDRKVLHTMQSKFFGDNYQKTNEDEMTYCSAKCAQTILGGCGGKVKECVGLHDWGRREDHVTGGIGGYACSFLESYKFTKSGQAKSFSYFSAPGITWKKAYRACRAKHGDLASIHSEAENQQVYALAGGDASPKTVWLGMTDEKTEGTWGWTDGSPWDFTKWAKGEPNNLGPGKGEDYGGFYGGKAISKGGLWADGANAWRGSIAQGYICQFHGGSVMGSKTKTPASTQHCTLYQNVKRDSWQAARAFCRSKGKDLPILRSAAENQHFLQTVKTAPRAVWLGLTDGRKDGRFEWVDRQRAVYTNWARGEPNGKDKENCVAMWTPTACSDWQASWGPACTRRAGEWNDAKCIADRASDKLSVACCTGGGHGSNIISTDGCSSLKDFTTMMTRVTTVCCEQKGDICVAGMPQRCSDACSRVVVPFAQACRKNYRNNPAVTAIVNGVVALCQTGGGH